MSTLLRAHFHYLQSNKFQQSGRATSRCRFACTWSAVYWNLQDLGGYFMLFGEPRLTCAQSKTQSSVPEKEEFIQTPLFSQFCSICTFGGDFLSIFLALSYLQQPGQNHLCSNRGGTKKQEQRKDINPLQTTRQGVMESCQEAGLRYQKGSYPGKRVTRKAQEMAWQPDHSEGEGGRKSRSFTSHGHSSSVGAVLMFPHPKWSCCQKCSLI